MDDFNCAFDGMDHSCANIPRWTEKDGIVYSTNSNQNVQDANNDDKGNQNQQAYLHDLSNENFYKNNPINIKLWIRENNSREVLHRMPHFQKFPLSFLAALACVNSPIGAVTEAEVISFILHHFPYYRFTCSSWRDALSASMKGDKRLGHNKTINGIDSVYLWNPGNLKYDAKCMKEIKKDPRGKEFFDRLIKGEIGLPRQLFYDIVGLHAPKYAGPENSIIFYHLLSIGHVPTPFSQFFRVYTKPNIHSEPKFVGDFCTKREDDKMGDLAKVIVPWFGLNHADGSARLLENNTNKAILHDYIALYFMQQKFLRGIDIRHWQVPPAFFLPFTK